MNAIYGKNHGFPEESAAISDLLGHPEGLQNLRDELEQFVQAYRENRELLRFHFHRPQKLLEQLSDLQREPLHFTAAEGYDPQRRFFISGDEINNLLRGGKRSTDYRLAVYSFYRNHTERKERVDFLKHYHGEYSGHSGGNDDVTYQLSKGVSFSHGSITAPYAKVELKWNAVEKRVSAMIAQGRFLTDEDRAAMPQYEKHQLARNIRTFFENVPQEQPHPYPFGFDYWDAVKLIEPQLDDPARVEEIYQMMVPRLGGHPRRMTGCMPCASRHLKTSPPSGREPSRSLQSTRSLRLLLCRKPKPTTWAMAIWEMGLLCGTGWRKNTGTTKRLPTSRRTAR